MKTPDFEIIKSKRKTISIEVKSDGTVIVRAPYRMSQTRIRAFVAEKESWILKHRQKARERAKQTQDMQPLTQEDLDKLRKQARQILPQKVWHYAKILNVTYDRIAIRCQKTRWGSCSAKGNLNFNCLLMLTPDEVIDYVVVHELCHRLEMNHSKAFWALVEQVMPDYKIWRKWLKENGTAIMNLIAE